MTDGHTIYPQDTFLWQVSQTCGDAAESDLDKFTVSCAWSGFPKTLFIGMVSMIPVLIPLEVRSLTM